MNVCPVCGYRGEQRTCPRDGLPLLAETFVQAPRVQPPPKAPTLFGGRYRTESLLGEGGMGQVWRVTNMLTEQVFALKVMHRHTSQDATAQKRFVREMRTLGQLRSPHTIRVFDCGHTPEGFPFMVMEFLEGCSLKDEIRRCGRLSVIRAAEIIRQICKSLGEAHQTGVVHRDLKPANIFLCQVPAETVFAKVLDFGILKLVETGDGLGSLTATGVALGTPLYIAPESLLGQTIDGRADLFSLGVLFYEMLAGRPPYTETNPGRLLMERRRNAYPRLAALLADDPLPSGVEALIDDMLQLDPLRRPPNAEAVSERLATVPFRPLPPPAPVSGPSACAPVDAEDLDFTLPMQRPPTPDEP